MISDINPWEHCEAVVPSRLIESLETIELVNLCDFWRILILVLVGGGQLISEELAVVIDAVGPVASFKVVLLDLPNMRLVPDPRVILKVHCFLNLLTVSIVIENDRDLVQVLVEWSDEVSVVHLTNFNLLRLENA